jgi:hypothetical protein
MQAPQSALHKNQLDSYRVFTYQAQPIARGVRLLGCKSLKYLGLTGFVFAMHKNAGQSCRICMATCLPT